MATAWYQAVSSSGSESWARLLGGTGIWSRGKALGLLWGGGFQLNTHPKQTTPAAQ